MKKLMKLMKRFLKCVVKAFIIITFTFGISVFFSLAFEEVVVYFQHLDLISETMRSDIATITGGIIGAAGAIISILISISKTNEIQEEHRQEELRKEKRQLADDIASLVAKYIAEISAYYFDCHSENYAERQLEQAQGNRVVEQIRLLKTKADKRTANAYYHMIFIKLDNVAEGKELLEKLKEVHCLATSEDNYQCFECKSADLEKLAKKIYHNLVNEH